MQKIRIKNWKWLIEDTALLHGWFENWEDFAANSVVKQNPVRTVFKVADLFYVKVEQPFDFWRKLRSSLFPKAVREFTVGQALETAGVPVVKHLGYAKNGAANMLLTEVFPDSRSVLEYWYSEIVYGSSAKKKFLDDFAAFLKIFFESGFYHPDFHIGNILYSPSSESFALVDVYGISGPYVLSSRRLDEHTRIILELARGLNEAEALELIMQVRSDFGLEEAQAFWLEGLRKRTRHTCRDWPKRRRQIQENYAKYIAPLKISGNDFLVRRQPGPVPAIALESIPDCLNGNNFDIMRLPHGKAENLWLDSFRLELLGIDHPRPLVFEKPGVLYFEKLPEGTPAASQDIAEEFIARAQDAGVEISTESLRQLPSGRVVDTKILFA